MKRPESHLDCPNCNYKLEINTGEFLQGKSIQCPKCGHEFSMSKDAIKGMQQVQEALEQLHKKEQ